MLGFFVCAFELSQVTTMAYAAGVPSPDLRVVTIGEKGCVVRSFPFFNIGTIRARFTVLSHATYV
jgi:hypothetical protein